MSKGAWGYGERGPMATTTGERAYYIWLMGVERMVQNEVGLGLQDVTKVNLRSLWNQDYSAQQAFEYICKEEGIDFYAEGDR